MLSAITDRAPSFLGLPRRPGRALRAEAHQPLDPVKPAGKPLHKNIAPDAAGATGPVAGLEARLDRRDELCVIDLAEAGRAVEPGVQARPRDIQHLTQPADRSDVTMSGDKGEPHITSLAKKSARHCA